MLTASCDPPHESPGGSERNRRATGDKRRSPPVVIDFDRVPATSTPGNRGSRHRWSDDSAPRGRAVFHLTQPAPDGTGEHSRAPGPGTIGKAVRIVGTHEIASDRTPFVGSTDDRREALLGGRRPEDVTVPEQPLTPVALDAQDTVVVERHHSVAGESDRLDGSIHGDAAAGGSRRRGGFGGIAAAGDPTA